MWQTVFNKTNSIILLSLPGEFSLPPTNVPLWHNCDWNIRNFCVWNRCSSPDRNLSLVDVTVDKSFFFFFLNVYLVLVLHTIPIYVVSIGSCLFHAPVICLSAWVSRWRWWSQISTLWPTTWSRSGCMWRQRSSWSRGSTVMCWRQLRGCTALHGSQSSSASTSIVSFSLG